MMNIELVKIMLGLEGVRVPNVLVEQGVLDNVRFNATDLEPVCIPEEAFVFEVPKYLVPGCCLSLTDLYQWYVLVLMGGQLGTDGLMGRLQRVRGAYFEYDGRLILSAGGLKLPCEDYVEGVFFRAGVSEMWRQYRHLELGYLATREDSRRKGLSRKVCSKLVEAVGSSRCFATTKSDVVEALLCSFGFRVVGNRFDGDIRLMVKN